MVMKWLDKIKDIIFKIKDYDRLEYDYCGVVDMATGGILSKSNYTMDSIREAMDLHLETMLSEMYHPAKRVEKILDTIGKDTTWMVVSLSNGDCDINFFRDGYRLENDEVSEKDKKIFEKKTRNFFKK